MNAGLPLIIAADLSDVLQTKGILLPDGAFDQTKLDTISEDLDLVAAIEAVLKRHGLVLPAGIDEILQLLPVIAAMFRGSLAERKALAKKLKHLQ
jgi:hypothetical protein